VVGGGAGGRDVTRLVNDDGRGVLGAGGREQLCAGVVHVRRDGRVVQLCVTAAVAAGGGAGGGRLLGLEGGTGTQRRHGARHQRLGVLCGRSQEKKEAANDRIRQETATPTSPQR